MDKEGINAYTQTMGYLFSHEKEENSVICDILDGIWGYCAKWEKSDKRQTNTVWYHLHVESEKARFGETESRMVVTRGWGKGIWKMLVKWYKDE